MSGPSPSKLFTAGSWLESSRLTGILRKETVGGALLLVAALAALVWANSPWRMPTSLCATPESGRRR